MSRVYHAAHREARNVQSRLYHASHKERIYAQIKEWQAAHSEVVRGYYAAYHERIHERRIEASRRYSQEHRQEHHAYYLKNKERYFAHRDKRRARLAAVLHTLTAQQWEAIKSAYDFRCAYCGEKPERLTKDHVLPVMLGGGTTAENIVPACWHCNSSKRQYLTMKPMKPEELRKVVAHSPSVLAP